MRTLPIAARVYVTAIIAAGTVLLAVCVPYATVDQPLLFLGLLVLSSLSTALKVSLPLTTSEWIEWGNPNEKPAFDYMIKYSPYDNIAAKNYPAMLVHVSLNDSQVPYWEGSKFVAKLRATKTDQNTLLLQAEWRIMVNRFMDTAFFYDAGTVAARRADLDLNGLKSDYGFGFRVHGPFATPLRIEVARCSEGSRLVVSTSPIF